MPALKLCAHLAALYLIEDFLQTLWFIITFHYNPLYDFYTFLNKKTNSDDKTVFKSVTFDVKHIFYFILLCNI